MKATVSDAIGLALIDVGTEIVTTVPGFGASEAIQSYNILANRKTIVSFHEEIAYSICHGGSLVGKRSSCLIKSQGFAKAFNAVTDSLYTNLTAGFVILIFEDYEGTHSDNILTVEHTVQSLNIPFLKSSAETIYSDITNAFVKSEELMLPYVILIDASEILNETDIQQKTGLKKEFIYRRNILSHVVHPLFSRYQYDVLMNKIIRNVENIDPPKIPEFTTGFSEGIQESVNAYKNVFDVFKEMRSEIVTGDTSSSSYYALPPYNCIDMVTHIGGSIPLAIGAYLAGFKDTWAISGDFGFISSGHLGLIEAANREIPLKILLFNNRKAAATGGQAIHRNILLRIMAGYEKYIKHISDPNNLIEINEILTEAITSDELTIVIVDY